HETCAGLVCPGGLARGHRGFFFGGEPRPQNPLSLFQPDARLRGKELHRRATPQGLRSRRHRLAPLTRTQLVRFRQQYMDPLARQRPREQRLIAVADPAARVDDHEQARERIAGAQGLDQARPGAALALRRAGVTIPRKIDDALLRRELEEVDQPRAPRCLAGTRQSVAPDDRVDGARLAGIRAPGKRDFRAPVGRKLLWSGGADEKTGVRKCGHGRSVQFGALASPQIRGRAERWRKEHRWQLPPPHCCPSCGAPHWSPHWPCRPSPAPETPSRRPQAAPAPTRVPRVPRQPPAAPRRLLHLSLPIPTWTARSRPAPPRPRCASPATARMATARIPHGRASLARTPSTLPSSCTSSRPASVRTR